MGVDRPLPPYIKRNPRIHSICTHLEASEGIASVALLGLKCASLLWFRKTDGCPALTGRGRNILSIMLFALDEMVTVMGPDFCVAGQQGVSMSAEKRGGNVGLALYLSVQSAKDVRDDRSGQATSNR
jgi:hypothetical protein